MSQLEDVTQALDELDSSVQALAARVQPQDLSPVLEKVAALKAEVDNIAPAA
jgi:hypothetical protein